MKICVVGTPTKLKTGLIRRFAEGKYTTDYLPILGVDITAKKIQVDNYNVKLIIVDTAEEEFFEKLRPSYYRGASGVIIVFKSDGKGDMSIPLGWIKEFRKHIPDERVPKFFVEVKSEKKNQEGGTIASNSDILYMNTILEDKINRKYAKIWITESNTIRNYHKFEETIIDLIRHIIYRTLLEDVDIACISSFLPNNAKKASLIQYYKEKTIGYCLHNCNTIPEQFIHSYNKSRKSKFILYPDQHLNQCLRSCPLFKLIVDRSEVNKIPSSFLEKFSENDEEFSD
ncbi:MAG: hypothetical protein ACXACU_13545 [Candidatus Hodarchaeales archaeon]|jgi:small GTP-binding protein